MEYENSQDCAAAIEGADRTQYFVLFSSADRRLFGRTVRLEPATGPKRTPFRSSVGQSQYGSRNFSTLRPVVAEVMPVRRPVQLIQVNALLGRRIIGLAASVVLRRRVI